MIQGGGMTPDMHERETHSPIVNEASSELRNERGTLAMARTGAVNSATAQFFINVADNVAKGPRQGLDHVDNSAGGFGYCVFGKVIDGMDVVDKIVQTPTRTVGPFENVPTEPILIKSVTREK
jgi:cyclophilin family peptidyl-prolyl cis-trans isomerase